MKYKIKEIRRRKKNKTLKTYINKNHTVISHQKRVPT
jgi:hypothetical protein